jgi:hypothetical protein
MGRAIPALRTLLAYEGSLDMADAAVAPEGMDGAPRRAQGLHVVELDSDYKEIIGRLREKASLDQVPARPVVVAIRRNARKRFEVVQLSDLAGRILRLCDGRRSVAEIGDLLSRSGEDTAGVPPAKACAFALELLRREGLIAA